MCADGKVVRAVAAELGKLQLVVDPVMVSTSGHVLLESDAVETVKQELFPMATIITPNLHEAQLLLEGRIIKSVPDMEQAARDLCKFGPKWVLVKGGHLCSSDDVGEDGVASPSKLAIDVLCCRQSGECEQISSAMIQTTHVHGTGCTLASSIAALMAIGHTVPDAVRRAKEYLSRAIAASAHLQLGNGKQGPMNHCWAIAQW